MLTSIEEAAAAGDLSQRVTPEAPLAARIKALVMAPDQPRLTGIDQLVTAVTTRSDPSRVA